MKRPLIIATIGAALACFTLLSFAASQTKIDKIVTQRQDNFKVLGKHTRTMRRLVSGTSPDWENLAGRVSEMETASARIISLFPKDSANTRVYTEASEAIWDNFDDFTRLQRANAQSLADMQNAIADKNLVALRRSFKKVGASCKDCHRKYRD